MRKDRLKILADYLIDHQFTEECAFDYANVHYKTDCGTAGCAMGHLPNVFPDHFMMDKNLSIVLINGDESLTNTFMNTKRFFDVDEEEYRFIFEPEDESDDYKPDMYATSTEVGHHILKFIGEPRV